MLLERRERRRSWHLVMVGVALVALVMVGTVYWVLRTSYDSYTGRAQAATETLALTVGFTLGTEMKLIDNALASVSQRLAETGAQGHLDLAATQRIADDQRRLVPQVEAIEVTDANGRVLNAADMREVSVADSDYFAQARAHPGQLLLSDPVLDPHTRKWSLVLARARNPADEKFVGIVFCKVSSDHFVDLFDDLTLGRHDAISLRTASLKLLARYSPSTADPATALGTSNVPEALRSLLARPDAHGFYISRATVDGVERASAFQRVPDYGLIVVVGLDTASFYQPWRRSAIELLLLATALSLLVALVLVEMWRRQRMLLAAERRARQTAAEQQLMLDNEIVGLAKLDHRVFTWHNKALARIFGYGPSEMIGQASRILYVSDEDHARIGEAYAQLARGMSYRTDLPMKRKDGSIVWVDLSGTQLPNGQAMWVMVDVSTAKLREETVTRLAEIDSLTGLFNRAALLASLQAELARQRVPADKLALAFVDLDGFKAVNDAHGHDAGDEVLKEVAKKVKDCVRGGDIAARLGGDEFVVVLSKVVDKADVRQVLSRLLAALKEPLVLSTGATIQIGASIGVALYPDDARDAEHLLVRADHAMYCAKRTGKGRAVFVDEEPDNLGFLSS